MQWLKPLRNRIPSCAITTGLALAVSLMTAQAGFLLEIDTDGADDGVLTYNSRFSFGGDTTTASQSVSSTAFGMSGGDSIFGGNGMAIGDTYLYTYNPSVDSDNLAIPAGEDLGGGILASGRTGGAPGTYAVFATWPYTENVGGGLVTYSAETAGDSFMIAVDQNFNGDNWYKLGEIDWTSGPINLSQVAGANSFVSMRAAGVLFELVPEPSSFSILALGALGLAALRRKNHR